MKSILSVIALSFLLGGCGTSKTYVTSAAREMPTWQICKRLLEGGHGDWKIPWYNSVVEERGENCEKYIGKFKPQPAAGPNHWSQRIGPAIQEMQREQERTQELNRRSLENSTPKICNVWNHGTSATVHCN